MALLTIEEVLGDEPDWAGLLFVADRARRARRVGELGLSGARHHVHCADRLAHAFFLNAQLHEYPLPALVDR
jgi:hypothetical protein